MEKRSYNNMDKQKRSLSYEKGKFYFSKQLERKFYFGLTIIMLLLGILAKVGLF